MGVKDCFTFRIQNFLEGEVELIGKDGEVQNIESYEYPFAVPNKDDNGQMLANNRVAGLADMVAAIAEERPHRCFKELALHKVDVMTAVLASGEERRFVDIQISCARPAPFTPKEAQALLK